MCSRHSRVPVPGHVWFIHVCSSHLSRTSGYWASPLTSVYFHLFLPFGQQPPSKEEIRGVFREIKVPVSLKYCCPHHTQELGQGTNLGWEIPELKSCVSVTSIQFVWKWFVWLGRGQIREIVQVAEPVTLVNFHSCTLWLCLFLLELILNKHEGTRQATDAGF